MNPEDNIEKFFEKRLKENSPIHEEWNTPSDDIWNSAKMHFPKEREKKKPFAYLWWGVGGLTLLIGALFIGFYFNQTNSIAAEENISAIANKTKQTKQPEAAVSNLTIEKTTELVTPNENKSNADTQQEVEKNILAKKEYNPKPEKREVQYTLVEPTEILENDEQKIVMKGNSEIGTIREAKVNANEILPLKVDEDVLPNQSLNETVELKGAERKPVALAGMEMKLEKEIEVKDELPEIALLPFQQKRPMRKWEVGLSYAPLLFLNENSLFEDNELDEDESVSGEMNFFNLNIPVTRRFNKRLSLSSGVMYSQIAIDLNLTVEEEYEKVISDSELRQSLQNKINGGAIFLNDDSQNIDLKIRDDVMLNGGDILTLQGNFPVNMSAVQIPVMLNYHMGKGRLEGLFHGGFTLDVYRAWIDELELEVYRLGALISEPVIFSRIETTDFGFTYYLGGGIKYHLNDHFNIGLNTRFDLSGLWFSRGEIGLYYGF